MNFYIASSFKNQDSVRYVSGKLKKQGYVQTYDWTKNERAASIKELSEIGQAELNAVKAADFLIALLPAGKGSHIEFGIALGQGKRIFLYAPSEDFFDFSVTSTFYHLPGVEITVGNLDELIEKVSMFMNDSN